MQKEHTKPVSLRKILARLERLEKKLDDFKIQNDKEHLELRNVLNGKGPVKE